LTKCVFLQKINIYGRENNLQKKDVRPYASMEKGA